MNKVLTRSIKTFVLHSLIMGLTYVQAYSQDNTGAVKQKKATIKQNKGNELKVKGVVKDAFTGKPLSGIGISVEGFSSTFTDDRGNYVISIPDNNAIITINGEGYQNKVIPAKGRAKVDVKLYEETFNSYFSNIILPYSNQSKFYSTYATENVEPDNNWQRASESSDTYLQGRVAGVNVIRRSGTPGIGGEMFVRGFNSLYTTSQPLIVVDGMLYDNNSYGSSLISGHVSNPLSDIDIKDVDSYTLIKDGTSMYGTKGANGVLLITTNRAKTQATKIDFAAYSGFNSKVNNLPVLNAYDYRVFLSDVLATNPAETQASIAAKPYLNASGSDYFKYDKSTDWQKEVLRNSFNQNYYMKVTGGDNIATYGLSVGYLKNSGVIRNTDLQRYQTRFNADLKLSTKLTAAANVSFVNSSQSLQNEGISIKTNPLYNAQVKAPFLYPYEITADNKISPVFAGVDPLNFSNPTALIENTIGVNKNYRFFGSVNFRYEIAKKLQVQTLFGVNYDKIRENLFVPTLGAVPDTLSTTITTNRLGTNTQRLFSVYNDTRLSYSTKVGRNSNFSANAGLRYNKSSREVDYGLGYNSATDNYISVGSGLTSLRDVGGENGEWNWMNIYANANYGLYNKYFIAVNAAVDGSSRFGKEAENALTFNGNKFAVMPSISAAWIVSSEKFLANSNIDLLKLRAGYGLVGNDDIGNYSSKQYYVSQNLLGSYGLDRGNIANPALKWETVRKANVGLDLALLNERLNLSADLYHNQTVNMLIRERAGTISGNDYILTNNGGMSTQGIDLASNIRAINKKLKWDIGFNISAYKNKIDKTPDGSFLTTGNAGEIYITQTGQAANLFYGYKTQGVYSSDVEAQASGLMNRTSSGAVTAFTGGDVRFIDTNNDGYIDDSDKQVIGNPSPDFFGAVSSALNYKRWSVDALFSFSVGNDIYNYTRRNLESMSGYQNQLAVVRNRWKSQGQITDIPKASYGDPAGNTRFSDRWIEDGSYFRVRTISIAYDVPKISTAIKSAKIYVTGNNLFTLTQYKGYDPEFSASSSIFRQGTDIGLEPIFSTVQLGIRIGL